MKIHFAKHTHIKEIAELANEIWNTAYSTILSKEQIQYMLNEMYSIESLEKQFYNQHIFKIVIVDNEIFGFGSYQQIAIDKTYKIHKLYVKKHSNYKSVGSTLLKNIENDISSLGGSEITLNVNRNNSAKIFYEKMGYQTTKSVDIPFGKFILNDYVMSKSLR